jgi:hypothetical protein
MPTNPFTREPVLEEPLEKQDPVIKRLLEGETEEAIDSRTSSLVVVQMVARTTPGDQIELIIVDREHKAEPVVCPRMLEQLEAVEEITT